MAELRGVLVGTVGKKDVRAIVQTLVNAAVGGDTQAARLVLERLFGPAVALDVLERLETLEAKIEEIQG